MDKSIPYVGVLMTKDDPGEYPRHALPVGYSFSFFQPGQENEWAHLQVQTGQLHTLADGCIYFAKEYLSDPGKVIRQLFFVRDPGGRAVGTASIWHGEHFGKVLPRVHWVSVLPEQQGQGIGKAMLTRALDLFNELGYRDFVYLTTQTWSYKAIRLYLAFGFRPYEGSKPANWSGTDQDFERDQALGWQLIMEKIGCWEAKTRREQP